MKRIFALLLAAALLLGGCTAKGKTDAENVPQTTDPTVAVLPTGEGKAPEPAPSLPDRSALYGKMQQMQPVLDALVGSMGVNGGNPYAPEDAGFVWFVLYLAAMDRAFSDGLVPEDSGSALVPTDVMTQIAGAAFPGMDALPPLPSDMPVIAFDAENNAYKLELSDSGDVETKLETYAQAEDGLVTATVGLYVGAGERCGAIRFTLTPDPDADSAYPYCVATAAEDTAPFEAWREINAGEPLTADLDGDGVEETIRISFSGDDMIPARVEITSGDVKSTDEMELGIMLAHAYLADIEAGDGKKELIVTGDMASDDYLTAIYRYENGAITRYELFGEATGATGGGRLEMRRYLNVLGTYGAACRFYMDPVFSFILESNYTVVRDDGDESWEWQGITLKKSGFPVTADDGRAVTLDKGTMLMVMASDEESYVDLVDKEGNAYCANIARKGDDWQWYIADVPESDWFEWLPYAG